MAEPKTNLVPEQHLLDALERISRKPDGFLAIHMMFSGLRPPNRQPRQLRILARMFDPIVNSSQSRLFAMSDGDMIVLGRGFTYADADEVIYKIRDMLKADPLVYDRDEDDFSAIYDVERDFDAVKQLIKKKHDESVRKKSQQVKPRPKARGIEPEDLDEVLKTMSTLEMGDLVRRQSAVRIGDKDKAEVVFQEYFTSMFDLKNRVAPDINLLADRWLFQHLSVTLDRRMLDVLGKVKLFYQPPSLSLNLNITTVFSREFARFARKVLSGGQKIICEIQLMDAFQNIDNYYEARDLLHKGGHRILLDSLSALSLQFVDVSLLKADMIKLFWSPGLADENQSPSPRELIEQIGPHRVVLARCDSEEGIKWGMSVGVRTFQGHFIDAMAGAVSKSMCTHGNRCSLAQCIKRRSVIDGKERFECHNKQLLDDYPDIRTF